MGRTHTVFGSAGVEVSVHDHVIIMWLSCDPVVGKAGQHDLFSFGNDLESAKNTFRKK